MRNRAISILSLMVVSVISLQAEVRTSEKHIYVDGKRGSDRAAGSQNSPLKSLYAAIEHIPKEIDRTLTIHLAAGDYTTTGGQGMHAQCLELNRRMRLGAKVRIIGNTADFAKPATIGAVTLNWQSQKSRFLIVATEGHWTLENIQLGTRKPGQRHGISVAGPALLELHNVRIHTIGQKGPGLRAQHNGRIFLYGNIELNEDLRNSSGSEESFCRIEAEYCGVVKFIQRKGATLTLGNGNLSASYYGVIELGCEEASITSWNYQSNPIAVNNSGRVDLHNTKTTLCARNPRNTPIGLEHDGHVLAEGARIIIDGKGNSNAIVLQKASSFFCNDVEIRGEVRHPLLAMSGSVLLVGIHGDLGEAWAHSGSTIIIEKCTGSLKGPLKETKSGRIVPPEGKSVDASKGSKGKADSGSESATETEAIDKAILPELHRAAYGGHSARVKQLIQQGADVHAKGPNGWTPLHIAAIRGHRMLSEMLLNMGADIRARDQEGRTPAKLAEIHGHPGLTNFLRTKESEAN